MIERRRFLTMVVSGVALGTAAVAVPSGVAAAATPTKHRSALRLKSWSRLTGSVIHARDPHGNTFRLTVERVVKDKSVGGGRGESFHVVLRGHARKLPDGIYRLKHRDLGGSTDLFLVGGASAATLSVDTRVGRAA